jgi:type VI protein secretion system component Hcp
MKKFDLGLAIAIAAAVAVSSPALAKDPKSSASSSLYKHSTSGKHYSNVQITAKKTSKPTHSEITVTKTNDKSSNK